MIKRSHTVATPPTGNNRVFQNPLFHQPQKNMHIECVSWNVAGSIDESKINTILTYLSSSTKDVIVIGFQECKQKHLGHLIQVINNRSKYNVSMNEQRKAYIATCTSTELVEPFVIASIVLTQKERVHIKTHEKVCPIISKKVIGTKGYIMFSITLGGITKSESIYFVNTHLPFNKDLTDYGRLLLRLTKEFEKLPANSNVIICGDVNSRSLIFPECYQKNITNLLQKPDYVKYEKALKSLNELTINQLNQQLPMPKLQKSGTIYHMLKTPCGINGEISNFNAKLKEKDFFSILLRKSPVQNEPLSSALSIIKYIILKSKDPTKDIKMNEVNQLATKKDIDIFNNFKEIMHGLRNFNESPITFRPTYKRNPDNGRFKLLGNKVRKPGYADRFIYKLNKNITPIEGSYVTKLWKGSDHLPVFHSFTI